MVDGITSSLFHTLPPAQAEDDAASLAALSGGGGFNAALEAAQKAAARKEAHDQEMAAIKDKGFRTWVRDTQIEKLKEELRKRVMAQMGLDDESMAQMTPLMRSILEQKIQQQVEAQLEAEFAKQQGAGNAQTAATADQPAATGAVAQGQQVEDQDQAMASTQSSADRRDRQKQPDGKDCPVIPALSWPGTLITL